MPTHVSETSLRPDMGISKERLNQIIDGADNIDVGVDPKKVREFLLAVWEENKDKPISEALWQEIAYWYMRSGNTESEQGNPLLARPSDFEVSPQTLAILEPEKTE